MPHYFPVTRKVEVRNHKRWPVQNYFTQHSCWLVDVDLNYLSTDLSLSKWSLLLALRTEFLDF